MYFSKVVDNTLEMGNVVFHFETSKYTFSCNLMNFKILHSLKCAAFLGRNLVSLDLYFLMTGRDWVYDYKQIHKLKCLAVPVLRLCQLLSEEHLLGTLRRNAYSGRFSLPLLFPFCFYFSYWRLPGMRDI